MKDRKDSHATHKTYLSYVLDVQEYAQKNGIPIMDHPTRQYIEKTLKNVRPRHCLEVWSCIWYSTICIAKIIESRDGSLVSFEISHPSYIRALTHMREVNITNTILHYGDICKLGTHIWAPSFDLCALFDFAFIDGNKADYLQYYQHILPYCATWCVLIFDDVLKFSQKVEPLVTYLDIHEIPYEIVPLYEDDGILRLVVWA